MDYRVDLEAAAARLKTLSRNFSTSIAVGNLHEAKRLLRSIKEEAANAETLNAATIDHQEKTLAGRLQQRGAQHHATV
jgi:ribosomal protein S20